MSERYKFITDLEEYVRLRAKKDTEITLQLREKISQMDEEELRLADKYYHNLLSARIRNLGEIGCIELAVKLTEWLYPLILKEAYNERSKTWMLLNDTPQRL